MSDLTSDNSPDADQLEPRVLAERFLIEAEAFRDGGSVEELHAAAVRALAEARRAGDKAAVVRGLRLLASASAAAGDVRGATRQLYEAVAQLNGLGDDRLAGATTLQLGLACARAANWPDAERHLEAAANHFAASGGDSESALATAMRSLVMLQRLARSSTPGDADANLAAMAEAKSLAMGAVDAVDRGPPNVEAALAHFAVGLAESRLGNLESAEMRLTLARTVAEQVGNPVVAAFSAIVAARNSSEAGMDQDAERSYRAALAFFAPGIATRATESAWRGLARIFERRHWQREAAQAARIASRLHTHRDAVARAAQAAIANARQPARAAESMKPPPAAFEAAESRVVVDLPTDSANRAAPRPIQSRATGTGTESGIARTVAQIRERGETAFIARLDGIGSTDSLADVEGGEALLRRWTAEHGGCVAGAAGRQAVVVGSSDNAAAQSLLEDLVRTFGALPQAVGLAIGYKVLTDPDALEDSIRLAEGALGTARHSDSNRVVMATEGPVVAYR